jgi:hypothetical protein
MADPEVESEVARRMLIRLLPWTALGVAAFLGGRRLAAYSTHLDGVTGVVVSATAYVLTFGGTVVACSTGADIALFGIHYVGNALIARGRRDDVEPQSSSFVMRHSIAFRMIAFGALAGAVMMASIAWTDPSFRVGGAVTAVCAAAGAIYAFVTLNLYTVAVSEQGLTFRRGAVVFVPWSSVTRVEIDVPRNRFVIITATRTFGLSLYMRNVDRFAAVLDERHLFVDSGDEQQATGGTSS